MRTGTPLTHYDLASLASECARPDLMWAAPSAGEATGRHARRALHPARHPRAVRGAWLLTLTAGLGLLATLMLLW
ncbi:MAG: hypothetical protein ABI574_09925 [Burkholderiales bacterium]